jgi:hypothetical protein
MLLAGFEETKEGEKCVCTLSKHCLWRNFQAIRTRAKLPRWKDAFKDLRKNCERDWAQVYLQYAVSFWAGQSIEVSAKHYLQVPEDLYDKVAITNEAQTATNSRHRVTAIK